MPREIKFRAKAADSERWIVGHYFTAPLTIENFGCGFLDTPDQKRIDCIEKEGVVWQIRLETLSESTGILDKNGKEIYEGDVVKYNETIPSTNEIQGIIQDADVVILDFIGKVIWDNEGCSFDIEGNEDYYRGFGSRGEVEIEVIGNIYENPKLLAQ